MQLQSAHPADYLTCTPVIDRHTPAIIAQTQAIIRSLRRDVEQARALFEWVRDTIPHSCDIRTDVVTCSASEVLEQRTGLCYAKSHLLAAMLRCAGIPAGFCYQVFRRQAPHHGLALHGLNGLYLASLGRWVRVDARGNTGTIDAQFSLTAERLAFPVDPLQGEFIYETIYTDPAPAVVAVLRGFTSLQALWPSLPGPFASAPEGSSMDGRTDGALTCSTSCARSLGSTSDSATVQHSPGADGRRSCLSRGDVGESVSPSDWTCEAESQDILS